MQILKDINKDVVKIPVIFTNDAYTQGETTIMNWEIKRLGTVNKLRWQFLPTFKQKSFFKASQQDC